MSVDYYIRLEQGRGPHPSRQVLAALARALMLTRDEREYLFRIAGETPPPAVGPSREVPPGLRHLLDAMTETPAYVVDAEYDVLAWNRLATYFVGDLSAVPDADRNMIRWMFRRPATDSHWTDAETIWFARGTVADLRAAYGRYPATRRSASWSPNCSAPRPGSPSSGPSTTSRNAGPSSSGCRIPSWGRWSSSARCCTCRRPTSG